MTNLTNHWDFFRLNPLYLPLDQVKAKIGKYNERKLKEISKKKPGIFHKLQKRPNFFSRLPRQKVV